MSASHCSTCGAFLRTGISHTCPPVRAVNLAGRGVAVNIYAASPAEAAAAFLESDDLSRCQWPTGPREVIVAEGKKKFKFEVTNTLGLTYQAIAIK